MLLSDEDVIDMIARYTPDEYDREMALRRSLRKFFFYVGNFAGVGAATILGGFTGLVLWLAILFMMFAVDLRRETVMIRMRRRQLFTQRDENVE